MSSLYDDWELRAQLSSIGRIWLSNLRFDKKFQNLPNPVLDALRDQLETYLIDPNGRNDGPIVQLLEVLRRSGPGAFFLKGTRKPKCLESLGTVVDAQSFGLYHIAEQYLRKLGLETDENVGERVYELLGDAILPMHYGKQLRTGQPFFWCTPTGDLQSLADQSLADKTFTKNWADEVRDSLGLQRIKGAIPLLLIKIPKDTCSDKLFAAPTTLDAAVVPPVFSPCAIGDGYGRTLHLRTLQDGLRELIVEPLEFGPGFNVDKIGRTLTTSPPPDLDHLYERCCTREAEYDGPTAK